MAMDFSITKVKGPLLPFDVLCGFPFASFSSSAVCTWAYLTMLLLQAFHSVISFCLYLNPHQQTASIPPPHPAASHRETTSFCLGNSTTVGFTTSGKSIPLPAFPTLENDNRVHVVT
jgi:hypothetical protein